MYRKNLAVMKNLWCFVCLTVVVAGCATGPVYRTRYSYTQPETPEGKACVYQCEFSKVQCEELEDLKKELCVEKAELKYERCMLDKKEGEYCYNESWQCSANYQRCDNMYRSCFQSCGGTIESETECVSNCDQILE